MEINVSIDNVTLQSLLEEDYDGQTTIGDRVVSELVSIAVRGDRWASVTKRVQDLRDEEIRNAVRAEIAEAITKPFKKTNSYGEETGETTTLRESIAKEAREALNMARTRNTYSQPQHTEGLAKLVQNEAANAVSALLKKEIAEETARIREAMRAKAVELVSGEKSK